MIDERTFFPVSNKTLAQVNRDNAQKHGLQVHDGEGQKLERLVLYNEISKKLFGKNFEDLTPKQSDQVMMHAMISRNSDPGL